MPLGSRPVFSGPRMMLGTLSSNLVWAAAGTASVKVIASEKGVIARAQSARGDLAARPPDCFGPAALVMTCEGIMDSAFR